MINGHKADLSDWLYGFNGVSIQNIHTPQRQIPELTYSGIIEVEATPVEVWE